MVDAVLTDAIADRGGTEQDLHAGYHAWPVDPLEERLRDHGLECIGDHGPDLVLLAGRIDIDDSLYRLRRVDGVKGTEDQMAGLGRGDREAGGLQVPHLADHDDVRVLAQDVLETGGKARAVKSDLPLFDHALVIIE